MQEATVRRILRHYGLSVTKLYPVQKGYRNESYPLGLRDGRTANLILYKHESGILDLIRRTNAVSISLANRGLPVRMPLEGRIMKVASADFARYACLYTYLPGETIPWEAYTQKHIKLLGQTLAKLHKALVSYDGPALPHVADEYTLIVRHMQHYFAGEPVSGAAAEKLDLAVPNRVFTRLLYILKMCEKLPGQPLHMDFVRSNILFSAEHDVAVTGVIDFEKAAYGSPLFDVARTLAFLLVDCKYKPMPKVRKYFIESGYQKRGERRLERITVIYHGERRQLLEELLDLFLLYDFYKFLHHNPYEYLQQNEHFVRTRDLLLTRGVITTTLIGSRRPETLLQ